MVKLEDFKHRLSSTLQDFLIDDIEGRPFLPHKLKITKQIKTVHMGSTVHYQFQMDYRTLTTDNPPTPPPNTREHAIPNEPTTKMPPVLCSLPNYLWLSIQSGLGLLFTGRGPSVAHNVFL